ncbi:MAG: DEAD/DEAH box helicase [Sedimentisphaerales bacterium]|nr:DEAD/DEAH box helicase [Sedimentisphaerales bacterium]
MSWFLSPEGPVAGTLSGYEQREEQIQLAEAIDAAFGQSRHLIAEAGTGIGKSFAYIIPAVSWAMKTNKKVVISTYTISLQEQLIYKDIPFIQKVSGLKFVTGLAKGRGNYVCWRRLEQARSRGATLFDESNHVDQLEMIRHWALATKDGSLSDLGFVPAHAVWDMVGSDSNMCAGRGCTRFESCFYQIARRRLFGSHLIVANHALLFSDLAVRQQGGKILPDFKLVVLDEAHNMENVASKHFGLRLSNYQMYFLLNRLFNPRTEKGILASHKNDTVLRLLLRAQQGDDDFFNEVLNFHARHLQGGHESKDSIRVVIPDGFANVLSGPLNDLGFYLHQLAQEVSEEQEALEIDAYGRRCMDFAGVVDAFISQKMPESVYWVEASRRRQTPRVVISAAPLNIGPTLQAVLFEPCDSVIMTSATLSTRGRQDGSEGAGSEQRGFYFFRSRIGIEDCQVLQLGSPFKYEEQVKVYVEATLPDPIKEASDFLEQSVAAMEKYLLQTQGKAFILFTNFRQLRHTAERLADFCREHDLLLLEQGRHHDRSVLLEEFRRNTNSILLGTDSFWQGVDVPGESLSNVMIVKLPFSVPDHPLLEARLEQIRSRGGSAFFDYQLPEAVLKFKQGFGRLIRTKKDKGIVVILDKRVIRKSYGRAFFQALPECPVEVVKE